MALEFWLPEGIHAEHILRVSDGKSVELSFFPYKMFHLDVFNSGPDDVKVMVNEQPIYLAVTLQNGRGRQYDAKSPKYWRVVLYAEAGKTADVTITTTR